jgi:hypothetical protein
MGEVGSIAAIVVAADAAAFPLDLPVGEIMTRLPSAAGEEASGADEEDNAGTDDDDGGE